METSGFDPEITIRKIAVLPVKLYPLYNIYYYISEKRIERLRFYSIKLKFACLPIPALGCL